MGSSHAKAGAAAWLVGSAVAAQYWHVHQSSAQILIGTALCAGGSLQPDWCLSGRVTSCEGGATVAKTFGVVSLFVAECVEKASLGIYCATKRKRDPDRDNGHRLATHTLIATVAAGAGVFWLCGRYGRWAVLSVLFFTLACALRALLGNKARRAGWLLLNLLAVAGTAAAYPLLPVGADGFRLLGLAVGVGCVVHLLTDCLTEHGSPLLAPLTWKPVRLPKWLRCKTGKKGERRWSWAFTALAILAIAPALFPEPTARFIAAL
jgi:membrane-bound metal-dependent hydrolase YbcI (DUF457 family)